MAESSDRPVAHVHDKFFKDQFQQLDFTRSVLSRLLPEPVALAMDWPSLAREDTSFIDQSLGGSACDLLFKTKYRERPAFIYILFEHQSLPDAQMPLRLLCYMARIWKRHLRGNPGEPPPVILPLVFHQGKEAWPYSLQFQDWLQLAKDDPLRDCQPSFNHLLLDLPCMDIRRVQIPVAEKLALLLMKCVREDTMDEYLEDLFSLFRSYYRQTEETQKVAVLLRYLFQSENKRGKGISTVSQIVRSLNEERPNEPPMTIYEAIKDEGRLEGRLEGRVEGLQKGQTRGILIGHIQTLQELLSEKISTPEDLASQNEEQLEAFRSELKKKIAGRR